MRKSQMKTNQTPKKYNLTFVYSKVISKTIKTSIPLGDKTVNPIVEEPSGLPTEPYLYTATHVTLL